MSIASRITSIEGHIGDIYDSVELTGVDTTDIDKNLVNVPNTLKEGYIDIINNGTDTLYNNFPKVSGEGTSLTLNNTYQAPMRNNLKGNTSQTGTSTTSSIPVNVVSGDNEINVVGKNLFDGIIYKENYVISSTGAESYNSSFNLYKMNLKPNTTYTIQFKSTDTIARSSRYIAYKSNDTFIEMIFDFNYSANESVTKTFTTPNETSYILFHIGKLVENIQVEKSSSASTYEPYQGNTYNIDLPVENLFNGIYYYTYTGGSSPYPYASAASTRSGVIKVEPNTTYTISKEVSNRFRISEYTEQPVVGSSNAINYIYPQNEDSITSYTLTTQSNTQYLVVQVTNSSQENIKMQVEKGSKANSYTPYGTTPIEMCKIGNYQDYFYKDSDKWYLHKEIKKVVLNGSETTWARADGNNDYRDFRIPLSDIALANTDPIGYIDNRFVAKTASYWNENGEHLVQMNDKRLSFRIAVSRLTDSTRESWISWLTNNHITTYYALATPTTTEITDTTLINQLEEIYIAKSKENQTNISQINNDLGFIISASALKKG